MSDQPLNDAWGRGADGKWYPPEQLWGAATPPSPAGASPWGAPPPVVPARPPRWPWLAVAAGGVASFVVLAVVGAVAADRDVEVESSARSAPTTTAELGPTTTSTTTTTTTTTTTSTTAAPATTAAPPPLPPPPTQPPPTPPPTTAAPPPPVYVAPPAEVGVHYENCAAARAAGAAPVLRGEPGYARHLDRDGDGIGCE